MDNALVAYEQKWAAQAEQYAEQEQRGVGQFLSTKGGILSLGEITFPGNQVCCIILDAVKENTYYTGKYDPDVQNAPTCYAFGRGNDEMSPHISMQQDPEYFQPQAETCEGCPQAVWGSADTGRGKACQNRRRLALIPAGLYEGKKGSRDFDLNLFDDPKHFQAADMVFIKLPVMSVKNWSTYVTQLSAAHHRPPHAVITRLFLLPDEKSQYAVHFEMIEELPAELYPVIDARHEEALKVVIQGYTAPQEQAPALQGSLKGLRQRR